MPCCIVRVANNSYPIMYCVYERERERGGERGIKRKREEEEKERD